MESFANRVIYSEVKAQIGYVWLDRTDKSNAMGSGFFSQLPQSISELDNNPEVRVIIVASTSRHFSTGLDLMELQDILTGGDAGDPHRTLATIEQLQESISSLATCKKPVIAAVNGHCIGGGLDLICYADIRLCSADAIFSVRETKLAMIADLGSLQRLPSLIGRGQLAELALTGRDFSASTAHEMGLVNNVCRDKVELMNKAFQLATEIAANSPTATQGVKEVLRNFYDQEIAKQLKLVAELSLPQLGSHDLAEAVTAFVEKRPPKFTGT
ncbi:MAG: enoyl-CoA hydratase [Acidimicrobiaceae bacterium]|nr:enoyl-CoA hydratase [Acidimicrobiaceae bacterium]